MKDIKVKEFYTQDDFDGFVRIAQAGNLNCMNEEQFEKLRENYNPSYDFDKDMEGFKKSSFVFVEKQESLHLMIFNIVLAFITSLLSGYMAGEIYREGIYLLLPFVVCGVLFVIHLLKEFETFYYMYFCAKEIEKVIKEIKGKE